MKPPDKSTLLLTTVLASVAFFCLPFPAFAAWTATTVYSTGNVGGYNSLAIGNDGFPVISHTDQTNFDDEDLLVTHCGNAACTSGNTTTAVDTLGGIAFSTSIAIGDDGLPVISYWDVTNGDLKVAHCGNAACSSGNTLTAVDTDNAGSSTSIAIGNDGFPVISYRYEVLNGDLRVTHCGNAACTAGNATTTVDSTGDTGYSTSIEIGNDGFPVISYYDDTGDDLEVAHCSNAACSASTTTTVDSGGSVGSSSSLAIGSDGFPVISYYDDTNDDLKVVKCGNADCSSGNTTTTVDSTGNVGQSTSIAIRDGLPVISYRDVTNSDLKIAYCGNAACSSGNTLTTVDSAGAVGSFTSISIGTDESLVISYYDSTNADLKVATEPIEVATPTPTPTPVSTTSTTPDSTSHDPAAGLTDLVLKDGVLSQTRTGTIQSGPVITIPATGGKAIAFSTKPPDADQLHELYLKVNNQRVIFKNTTTDPNNPLFSTTARLPPGTYPYTLTADYGFTTLSQRGTLIVEPSTSDLISRINRLFHSVFTRNPTVAENTYWQTRIQNKEKTTFADLIGAMQWQQLFGQ